MPFVPAKCTECGANLEIDSSKDAAICPYCNTPFVTEKAINNYNTYNTTNVEHLHADNVFVGDKERLENNLVAAKKLLDISDFDGAEGILEDLRNINPNEWRVWWYSIFSVSRNFTTALNNTIKVKIKAFYNRAIALADENDKKFCEAEMKYFIAQKGEELEEELQSLKEKNEQLKEKEATDKKEFDILRSKIQSISPSDPSVLSCFLTLVILFVSVILGIINESFVTIIVLFLVLVVVMDLIIHKVHDIRIERCKDSVDVLKNKQDNIIEELRSIEIQKLQCKMDIELLEKNLEAIKNFF